MYDILSPRIHCAGMGNSSMHAWFGWNKVRPPYKYSCHIQGLLLVLSARCWKVPLWIKSKGLKRKRKAPFSFLEITAYTGVETGTKDDCCLHVGPPPQELHGHPTHSSPKRLNNWRFWFYAIMFGKTWNYTAINSVPWSCHTPHDQSKSVMLVICI